MKLDDLLGILLAVAMLCAFGLIGYGFDRLIAWFSGEPDENREYVSECRNRLRDINDRDVVASMRKWEGQ